MSKIRESAKGEDCSLRVPGVCNGNSETVVLAHLPSVAKGVGNKSPDFWAAYACSSCHAWLDGPSSQVAWRWVLDGLFETQVKLIERGLMGYG